MKIGILSDSHDNLPAIAKAVSVFNDAEVELVIHAGDMVSPFVSIPLKNLRCGLIGVFGNNDGERLGLSRVFQNQIHRPPHIQRVGTRRVCILHEPDNLEALADSGHFDAIIYGHTHEIDVRKAKTLIINPGETGGWLKGKRTIALWDVESEHVDILPV